MLNAGNPTTLGLADTTELTAAARAGLLEGYLERGGPLLAMHISREQPAWYPGVAGHRRWQLGPGPHSMHPPPHSQTSVDVHPRTSPHSRLTYRTSRWSMSATATLSLPPDVVPLVSHVHDDIRHPLFWARTYGRARVVYDALGHGAEASDDSPGHRELLAAAVRWLTSDSRTIN